MATPEPLDAAADLFHRDGAADRILAVTVRTAADLAGVSRATIYRHWETAEALGTDLVVHLATQVRGWSDLVVDADPSGRLGAAVAQAMAGIGNDLGLLARSTVAAWPVGTPGRAEVVAAEATALHRLGRWLDRAVAAAGRTWAPRASADLAALAATVLVEGAIVDGALHHPQGSIAADPARRRPTAEAVGWLVDDLTVPGTGPTDAPAGDADPAGAAEPDDPRSVILRAIAAAAADQAPWASGLTSGGRLVDTRRLARALGVSVRHLERVWPTAASFDADLAEHLLTLQRRQRERSGAEVLAGGRLDGLALDRVAITRIHEAVVDPQALGPSPYDLGAAALADPIVRERVRTARDAWRQADRVSTMALVSLVGRRLRDEVNPPTFTEAIFDAILAATRWAALHPDLAGRTTPFGEERAPVLGLACWLVARAHLVH